MKGTIAHMACEAFRSKRNTRGTSGSYLRVQTWVNSSARGPQIARTHATLRRRRSHPSTNLVEKIHAIRGLGRPLPVCVWLCLWIHLLFSPQAHAQLGVMQRTLHGIDKTFVSVEGIPPSLEKLGLSARGLQTEAEKKLGEAGIRILDAAGWRQAPERPCLTIEIKTFEQPGPTPEAGDKYAYSVEVRFFQTVALYRNPEVRSISPTWVSQSALGITNERNVMIIQEYALNFVLDFLNDFRLANKLPPTAGLEQVE